MIKTRTILFVMLLTLLTAGVLQSQEPVDWDAVSKIRDEGFKRSKVMDYVGYMSDVLGPRLTASPSMRKAQDWAVETFRELGFVNIVVEEAGDHGVSWDNEYTSLHMMEPDYKVLLGYPKAFTPGTDGKITAEAVHVSIRTEKDFDEYRGKLGGKIVFYSPMTDIGFEFEPDAKRLTTEQLENISRTNPVSTGGRNTVTISQDEYRKLRRGETPPPPVSFNKMTEFFKAEGVRMLVDCGDGRGDEGTVYTGARSGSRGNRGYDGVMSALPEVSLASEQYNRICRVLKRGIPVKLEMEVRNYVSNRDTKYYNVLADLPGTDLDDEIVIIGGHYDSWHTGTGAVDNASGCAVALEAARIIKAVGLEPRRTIRVAFWTYEEGGLHGSREYVKKHFGNPTDGKKPGYDKFSGYFNMDNGAGQFRGINLQGNELCRPIFEAWMKPLEDLGVTTVSGRSVGGTDHLSFNRAGLNGWQFIQDGIDYFPVRHHTNMDVYDGLIPKDLMINAVVMATFAYHASVRDDLLPRKPNLQMNR